MNTLKITMTGKREGHIDCPVCGEKMRFLWIEEDSFCHGEPVYDAPQFNWTDHTITITALNCAGCHTSINAMVLTPSENLLIEVKYIPPIAL